MIMYKSKNPDLTKIDGFDWDEGNLLKNKIKHDVESKECEEVFLNEPLRFFDDNIHSDKEIRYGVLGKTNKGRSLTVFFTIRKNKIRVISAYDQGKKDRKIYAEVEREMKDEKQN